MATQTPRVLDIKQYNDGTGAIIVQIIRKNASMTPPTGFVCVESLLSLRIIHQNGSVTEIDVDLGLQYINYCFGGDTSVRPIRPYPLYNEHILVTYTNATDENNVSTYSEWGMIINWSGNVLSSIRFGQSYVNPDTNVWGLNKAAIRINIDPKQGFLRLSQITRQANSEWQQYAVDANGQISLLSRDILQEYGNISTSIATTDGGYAIVYANSTNNINISDDPFMARAGMYAIFLARNQPNTGIPYALYQSSLPNLNTTVVRCSVDYTGIGHICTLTIARATTNFTNANATDSLITPLFSPFYIKVRFLSSGSVISLSTIQKLNPDPNIIEYSVDSLVYGGYVLTTYRPTTPTTLGFFLYLFNELDQQVTWELPEPQSTNFAGIHYVLSNNTLLLAQLETPTSWSLLVNDLPRFVGNQGKNNLICYHVNSSDPGINSTISSNISSISITFYDQVDLSEGNITIYQIIDSDNAIVRQVVSGNNNQYCTLSSDGKSVIINVIPSAFNSPGQQYYVQIDNNFVRSRSFKEPLLGIQPPPLENFTRAADTTGLLCLTTIGTQMFRQMNSSAKSAFFKSLKSELSQIIPVKPERLSSNENSQAISGGTPSEQALISLTISDSKNNTDRSVPLVIQDLNTMIGNIDVTLISAGNVTKYLDKNYGFKGQNIAILQLGLIVFDLVVHLLFVIENSNDIPWLYIPSLVFLVAPIGLNVIIAFWIIMNENTNQKFFTWFINHGKVVSVFTLLAASDIEALRILQSNIAGFQFFQAPFSKTALSRIFWSACLNIFIEDIPRVVIQTIYFRYTVVYDLIPLLALVSSCITLVVNIIGRIYEGTSRLRHQDIPTITKSDDDDGKGKSGDHEKDEYNKYKTPGDDYTKEDNSWNNTNTRASVASSEGTRVSGDYKASKSSFQESI
ncbi:3436_t:CDS:2 [Dentiscutata erythropus]|uniref:3436_t:CDS:1 n=1 Tax=Dentiscutata erythropus TaxID=1348616 RepID=A0A9N9GXI6_9GLOM|nr:3436_t:CDS:2 [Dentiscutata erythropus]